jgi:hypothetical protein
VRVQADEILHQISSLGSIWEFFSYGEINGKA